MLYLTIPLAVALLAVLAIAVIAWRKMPFLRKLTPDAHPPGASLLHEYAPELIDSAKRLPWRQFLHETLVRIETGLKGIREAFRRLDQASDRFVRTVRRGAQQAAQKHEEAVARQAEERQEQERDMDEVDFDDPAQLKAEEQRLIVAIAQNPKDHTLYSDLARVSMRMHTWKDAVEALEQAYRLQPENEQYLKRLERAKRKLSEQTVV